MLIKIKTNKTVISTWLLLGFTLALFSAAEISFLFQRSMEFHQSFGHHVLFKKKDFHKLNKFIIKNQLGKFQFERVSNTSEWNITSPRTFPANLTKLNEFFSSLLEINILNILKKDPINISHYSLKTPYMELIFHTNNNKYSIKFGIMNPVNNSTYIIHSEYDEIFHIKSLNSNIESFILSDFIDSRIFAVSPQKISTLTLFRGNKRNKNTQINLKRTETDTWVGRNKRELDKKKVSAFLENFTNLKSQMILDKISEKTSKTLTKYFKSPLYTVEIKEIGQETITYLIGHIIRKLPDVKIEKRNTFIVQASNNKYPYVVHKDNLNLFYQTEKSLSN